MARRLSRCDGWTYPISSGTNGGPRDGRSATSPGSWTCPHGAVAQWESGATKPTIVNLLDMFMLFGISASELKSTGSPFAGQLGGRRRGVGAAGRVAAA